MKIERNPQVENLLKEYRKQVVNLTARDKTKKKEKGVYGKSPLISILESQSQPLGPPASLASISLWVARISCLMLRRSWRRSYSARRSALETSKALKGFINHCHHLGHVGATLEIIDHLLYNLAKKTTWKIKMLNLFTGKASQPVIQKEYPDELGKGCRLLKKLVTP